MTREEEVKNIMASFRTLKGLTIDDAAKEVGISYATYQKYESKPYTMTMEVFDKLVDLFGPDFARVFFEEKLYKMYS